MGNILALRSMKILYDPDNNGRVMMGNRSCKSGVLGENPVSDRGSVSPGPFGKY
jgi:hypothetical protein